MDQQPIFGCLPVYIICLFLSFMTEYSNITLNFPLIFDSLVIQPRLRKLCFAHAIKMFWYKIYNRKNLVVKWWLMCHLYVFYGFWLPILRRLKLLTYCDNHISFLVRTKFKTKIFISKKYFWFIWYRFQMIQAHFFVSLDTKYLFFRPNLSFIKNRFYHH